MKRMRTTVEGLLSSVVLFGLLSFSSAALAQEESAAAQPGPDAADEPAGPQFKFNLAPGKNTPGAQAEVLLTAKPEGGYTAELSVSSLPEPSALEAKAVTYVVWLYDPAAKKKERVAALATKAGAGSMSFDISWPKFALVVTAEPSAEPQEWSGIAVLTGQPALPETAPVAKPEAAPAEGAPAAAPAAPAEAAGQAGQDEAGAMAKAGAPPAPAQPPAPAAPAEGPAPGAAAPQPPGPPQGPTEAAAQAPAAKAAPGQAVAKAGEAEAAADEEAAMAEAEVAVSAEEEGQAEAVETEEERKKRVRNEALDAMAAAARGEGAPKKPKATEAAEEEEGKKDELDELAAAARGPELTARIKLKGTDMAPDAGGKLEVGADGTARLSAKLPLPSEVGAQLNSYVLWTIDPATGRSKPLGALQGSEPGLWTLSTSGVEAGSALVVTAEPGPQPAARGRAVVLSGRWEKD